MMMQIVWITLSDGEKLRFAGAEQIQVGDKRTISRIEFLEPMPAPEGYRLEKILPE